MADLLTHSLFNYLLGAHVARLRPREVAWLVSGGLLPDLLSRAPQMSVDLLWPLSVPVGAVQFVLNGAELFHTPIGILGVALALALLLPTLYIAPPGRRRAGTLLAVGGLLHFAIDLLQHHLSPGYLPFYPISRRWFEFGLLPATLSHYSWPVLVPLSFWLHRRELDRGAPGILKTSALARSPAADRADPEAGSGR